MATSTRSDRRGAFWRIATAGVFFQGGAAAVDTSTIIAALVNGLTGSPVAVGGAAAIARYGWLFPQLFVAYFAQKRRRRMPFYMLGAFGRVACLAAVGMAMALSGPLPGVLIVGAFFVLWTVYAFVGGIVAVPYNDIVARVIPSSHRSRLLATRFFGGGLLALAVAAAAHEILAALPSRAGYGAIFLLGAVLFTASALFFVSAGEPDAPMPPRTSPGFGAFLRGGLEVVRGDPRFRAFVVVRWLGGTVAMALPFYILQLPASEGVVPSVGLLLGAQTAGALLSNPFWGWLGDRRGKLGLLAVVVAIGVAAPALTVAWLVVEGPGSAGLAWFAAVFFLLGAVGNGETIATLGYLMEISPDDRRPAYSGYFNALAAPAALLPLAGAGIVGLASFVVLFAISAVAALVQVVMVRRLRTIEREGGR